MSVNIENVCVTSYGGVEEDQLNCLDAWMLTYLSFTDFETDNGVPKAALLDGQDALHAHADQVRTSQWPFKNANIFLGSNKLDRFDRVSVQVSN